MRNAHWSLRVRVPKRGALATSVVLVVVAGSLAAASWIEPLLRNRELTAASTPSVQTASAIPTAPAVPTAPPRQAAPLRPTTPPPVADTAPAAPPVVVAINHPPVPAPTARSSVPAPAPHAAVPVPTPVPAHAREEAARQELARQEAARREAARQEAARHEAARQETARHEAAETRQVARQPGHLPYSLRRHAKHRTPTEEASPATKTASVVGFGAYALVAEARRYIGTNPTARANLWCARFMNFVLNRKGYRGTNSDAALSFANYGHRIAGPRIGAIAVMRRKGGGHVGIVSGIDRHGNPILISGNNGRYGVGESVYPRSRILAYVMPSR
jgi:uncharacterized protein (TIGR02594 family)